MRPGSDVISGLVAGDDVTPLVVVAAVAPAVRACAKQFELVYHSDRAERPWLGSVPCDD